MFLDINKFDNKSHQVETDICVVGSGIAGIAFAREFAKTNHKVVLLESGSFEPDSDVQNLNKGKNIGLPYYELHKARKRAFGGSSLLWNLECDLQINQNVDDKDWVRLRGLDTIDFEKRDWVPNSGWPFDKSHLDPYYIRAHKVLKIGPYIYNPEYWEQVLGVKKIPFKTDKVKTTVFQFARNNVFYDDYKEELRKSKNISVYLNATALKIKLNEYARTTESIEASSLNGYDISVKAKYYVLAQGGLETPRLMMLSNDVMNKGVGNQNDLVGRFFMEHPHLWCGTFIPASQHLYKNNSLYGLNVQKNTSYMGKLIVSDSVMKEQRLMNNSLNFLNRVPMASLIKPGRALKRFRNSLRKAEFSSDTIEDIKTIWSNTGVLSYAALKKISRGDHEKWYQKNKKYDGYSLNIMAEQYPDPESRILLDDERDEFGQNKIKLNWKVNSEDMRSIRRFLEVINQELKNDSLGEILSLPKDDSIPDDLHGGYHNMGTARMNNDPKLGVVDENCQVHGVENLYIAGSSVFPTSGYANPTLTIVALSVRLADHFKTMMNNHNNSEDYSYTNSGENRVHKTHS